jgi:hypothetical protein
VQERHNEFDNNSIVIINASRSEAMMRRAGHYHDFGKYWSFTRKMTASHPHHYNLLL